MDGLTYEELELLIRRFLVPTVPDADDLSDLTQECMIKIWRRGDTFEGRSAFSSWVYRVARNEFLSWTRRSARRARHQHRLAELYESDVDDRLETTVLSKVATDRLLHALCERDREVLKLRYLLGLTSTQIGRELGLAPSSVRCRILRVRAAHHHRAA